MDIKEVTVVTEYEMQVKDVLKDLRQQSHLISMSVQPYPLECNHKLREMRKIRSEDLVILRKMQPSSQSDEMMLLIDYVNECSYWFSHSDKQLGSAI